MKINKLKINSFGKIKNKEIELKNGINILYGKNEAGKSTILNFIINSFYGISKNKRGKELSDYDKYKPWDTEEFSGKIEYELDNNEKFEVYRDFNKKNPKIFNENSEEISKKFNIDKKTGNEFFYEQTKVDEDLFLSTIGILQKEVELGKTNRNFLVQKLANLVGTGEDNVSYKRAIDRINRRQLDEIGTDRSKEKPINIINRNIYELEEEKQDLEKYQNVKYDIEENENKLLKNINELENKNNYLKEIKLLFENKKIEKEKIKIKENIKIENENKIKILENKLNEEKNKNIEKIKQNNLENKNNKKLKNKLNKKIILFFIILLIINLIIFFKVNNIIKYIFLLTIPTYLTIAFLLKNKLNKKINNAKKEVIENNQINNLENQINLLKINNENLNKELIELNNKFNLKNNLESEKIKNKYEKIILESDLLNLNNLEEINYKLEKMQSELNKNKIEIHKLKLDKENIEPNLEKLSKLEEKLINNKNKKIELLKLNESMDMAKEYLIDSYEEMKQLVTPKFTNNLSNIISKITEEKYNKIKFNEENGIMIELNNGNYVSVDNLSTGTIEQLYFSLRISMIDELSEETLPIFLDETFAYYDNERLKNALKYINNLGQRQIIILTCSTREQEILNESNIGYNLVNI